MIENGVSCIEIDIYYSKDLIPMVFHGDLYGRFEQALPENGIEIGMLAKDVLASDMKALDIGHGEQIPTLAETLELCKGRIRINIEIKETNPAIVDDVIRLVDHY